MPSYRIEYERPSVIANPPPPAHAVGITADGKRFVMRDTREFKAFYATVADELAPLELADLLVEFQAPNRQHVMKSLDPDPDPMGRRGWFDPQQVRNVKGFTLPIIDPRMKTALSVFCARSVEWPSSLTNTLYRWEISLDSSGAISWTMREIASGLRCPFYQGPF